MFKNKNVLIIALIAIVNALGYGIIIPIMYSYSVKFGLSDFQNGLLFAIFSVCQFLATPLIGRLSDKYGRRPMLLLSISGTALSFILMAFAPSAIFLFLARALDGITAGNIPVAQAVISDTTEAKDRARGFGIIGASFGFGFLFGPAISAATYEYWSALPFLIAASISLLAVLLTYLFLPETNKHIGQVSTEKLYDFSKLWHALFNPNVGPTLLISLFYFVAFMCYIIGFQVFTVKGLHMSPTQISILFTLFGLVGLIVQGGLVYRISGRFGLKRTLQWALFLVSLVFFALYFMTGIGAYIGVSMLLSFVNAVNQPLVPTILSQETDAKSQGSMMGVNASYMSIGQIIGPILGGFLAEYSINLPMLASSFFAMVCFGLSFLVLRPGVKKDDAF